MYSMYIMILTAAAARLPACLPACLPIRQIIEYFAFPYASSLALILNVALFLSEAKRDIECLHVLWIWSLPNSWFTARHLLSFSSWFLFLHRRCLVLGLSLSDLVLRRQFVQFSPFALLLGFFSDVCSVVRLSLSDLVLCRCLFNSLPFALGLVSCFIAVVCSVPRHRSSLSDSTRLKTQKLLHVSFKLYTCGVPRSIRGQPCISPFC